MDVQCPKCRQTVVIRRELGESEKLVTHCPSCDTAFIVKRKPKAPASRAGSKAPEPEAPPLDGSSTSTWHIKKQDGTILSFQSIRTLQTWVVAGIVSQNDFISRKGVQWKRVGALPELASFIEKTHQLYAETEASLVASPPDRATLGPTVTARPDVSGAEFDGIELVAPDGASPTAAPRPPEPPRVSFGGADVTWTSEDIPQGARPKTRGEGGGWRYVLPVLVLLAIGGVVAILLWPDAHRQAQSNESPEPTRLNAATVSAQPSSSAAVEAQASETGSTSLADGERVPPADERRPSAALAGEAPAREDAADSEADAPELELEPVEVGQAAPAATAPAAASSPGEPGDEAAPAGDRATEETAPAKEDRVASPTTRAGAAKSAKRPARRGGQRRARRAKATAGGYEALMDEAGRLSSSSPAEAAALYLKASQRAPSSVEPVAQLGWCHLRMGKTAKAFQYFKQAIRLNPRFVDSYRGLARAYERAGYRREACEEYGRYLDRLPATSSRATKTRARMSRLGCEP